MEHNVKLKRSSRHQNTSKAAKEGILLQQACYNVKLQDKLKTAQLTNQLNKEPHYRRSQEIVRYKGKQDDNHRLLISPKSSENHKKQLTDSEGTQNDELLKYMSSLPFYLQHLERGKDPQEKALNFGVLDWEHLEKWKYKKKLIPSRSMTYYSSTSDASSSYTTVGSSTSSGRSRCATCALLKKQSHSSFSNLNSTLHGEVNQRLKSTWGDVNILQETRTGPKNSLRGTQKLIASDQFFCQNSDIEREKKVKRKDLVAKVIPEKIIPSSRLKDCGVSFCPKGEMTVSDGKFERRSELHQLTFTLPDNPCPGRHKNIILVLPRDCSPSSSSGISNWVKSSVSADGKSSEVGRKSFSDCLHQKEEVNFSDLLTDVPRSCPLPCRFEESKESDTKLPVAKLPNSLCVKGKEVQSDESGLTVLSNEVPNGNDYDVEENRPLSSITLESKCRLDPNAAEVRNALPNHQLTVGFSRLSRSFSSEGVSAIPQLRSSYVGAKSGPERSSVPAFSDDSANDKPNTNRRGRSSPLRRLLEPLLKPKAGNCPDPLLKESKSNHRDCKSFDGQPHSSTVQSMRKKLNQPVSVDDSCPSKHVEPMMHALMQVTVKNGLPLFTFVSDSTTDVLVATVRKESTTVKDSSSWVYTICSVHEIKKKSGIWANHGSRGKNHGYASSVVGQIKLSLSQCPMLKDDDSKDHFQVKEFVLFGVEPRQADHETLDFHPNHELAAIVFKLLEENPGTFGNDGRQRNKNKDISDMGLSSSMPEGRCSCNADEDLESEHNPGTKRVTRTEVIIPSGVHSLPSTGVPTSLVDRWKSGGSCDCGGWDMGCSLRILANHGQCSDNFTSFKASSTPDHFDLFIQGGSQESKPVFSLAPFKKGIFSVDFHGSLTLLQAFSICVAVVNNRKPYNPSEASNMFEAKDPQETISTENDGINADFESWNM